MSKKPLPANPADVAKYEASRRSKSPVATKGLAPKAPASPPPPVERPRIKMFRIDRSESSEEDEALEVRDCNIRGTAAEAEAELDEDPEIRHRNVRRAAAETGLEDPGGRARV